MTACRPSVPPSGGGLARQNDLVMYVVSDAAGNTDAMGKLGWFIAEAPVDTTTVDLVYFTDSPSQAGVDPLHKFR